MAWDIRIGQRVICVQDHSVWANFCCDLPCWPLLDEIYTVSGFAEIEDTPGIYLHELPPVSCECHQLSGAPWPAECFRPLDGRSTDISVLMKIAEGKVDVGAGERRKVDAAGLLHLP